MLKKNIKLVKSFRYKLKENRVTPIIKKTIPKIMKSFLQKLNNQTKQGAAIIQIYTRIFILIQAKKPVILKLNFKLRCLKKNSVDLKILPNL